MDPMQEQLNNIEHKVNQICDALLGTDFNNNQGLIDKVEKHNKYIESDKKFKWTIAGVLMVLALVREKILALIF
jgi:hypothetical protein